MSLAHRSKDAIDWLTDITININSGISVIHKLSCKQGRELVVNRCVRAVVGNRDENQCKVEALVRSRGAEGTYFQVRVHFSLGNSSSTTTTTIDHHVCSCSKK
jgi:hypothetical protein